METKAAILFNLWTAATMDTTAMQKNNPGPFNKTYCRAALAALAMVTLASCRLVVSTGEGGSIISASGQADCPDAQCTFEISEKVTETFTAVPDDGYRFVRWEELCARSPAATCDITVFPLPAELQAYSGDIGLHAVFEPDSTVRKWYRDRDGDQYGASNQQRTAAKQPPGFVINKNDCNDFDSNIHPFSKEREDGKDNNCNGITDEGFVESRFYADTDGDGFGDPDSSILKRRKPAGHAINDLDCDDSRADVYPGAPELADQLDNDCNGAIDDGGSTWFRDVDGDGFGTTANSIESLQAVSGYVERNGDCDDNNASVFPEAEETFDSVDNNCDGRVDEGFTERTFYRDTDGDGVGEAGDTVFGLTAPDGYASRYGDNCPNTANANQADLDRDGLGDACDDFTDSDRDGVQDSADNCPLRANSGQADADNDGLGDACDSVDNNPAPGDPAPGDPSPGNPSPGDPGPGDPACASSPEAQAMLDAVNAFRAQPRQCGSRGNFPAVGALTWSCQLETAALVHSRDMAQNSFFDHTGSDNSSAGQRATRAGYSWRTWGENIAAGYRSVDAVMQGWINSSGHCANMMNANFRNLGSAKFSLSGSPYGVYWTQVFGASR